MTAFTRGGRVRILWPGTELHNRTATVLHSATIAEADGTTTPARALTLDEPTADDRTAIVVPAVWLAPEGGA